MSTPDRVRAKRRGRQLRAAMVSALVVLVVAGILVATHRSPPRPVSSASKASSSSTKVSSPAPKPPSQQPASGPQAIDPGQFAAGACLRYAPTARDRHLSVFLDAGHGGIDPGAVGTTSSGQQVEEADLTLPVELDTMADLRDAGFTVVVSRTGDTTVTKLTPQDVSGGVLTVQGVHNDVAARAICANEAHADLLVGIYFDAGSSPTNAGCVTGYDAVRSFASSNLRFAQLLQDDVLQAMNNQGWQIPDEGVITDNNLGSAVSQAAVSYGHLMLLGPAKAGYFTTPSQMPGALIEPLFLTDPFEATIAANPHDQHIIAAAIAAAVEEYFAPSR